MIKIVDDFFDNNDLLLVKDFTLTKALYTPVFFNNTKEKIKENSYGNRFPLESEPKLLNLFKKQAENKFKIKIKKIHHSSGIDQRNLNYFKPHKDPGGILNILIMISGPEAVTNGTVFYYGTEENCVLDMHVGFRENRAVMFPSNKIHSPHASNISNITRYTATLFIENYEE
jgi:hypothetical protein